MGKQTLEQRLIQFLTQEPACQKTLGCLNKKAEIAIEVENQIHLSVKYQDQKVLVKREKPLAPDFIFSTCQDTIETLISKKGLSSGSLGVVFLKQILNGNVKISMLSNILHISTKGYPKILKVGGIEFLKELKKYNLTSLSKILSVLKKFRKR